MKSNNLRSSSRSTVAEVIGKRISEKNLVAENPRESGEDDDDAGRGMAEELTTVPAASYPSGLIILVG